MTTVADLVSQLKNPYREEDYFSLNVRNGVMRSSTGTRMLAIPEELIQGLHAGLEEECGVAAPIVLYQCGKWWGKQFVKRQALEVRQFFGDEMSELPTAFYLQILQRVWGLYGWGSIDVSFAHQEMGFIEVRVAQAMYSDVVGNVGRTTDHLIAGVLASVIGDVSGRELDCVETACRSRGDQRCLFLVGVQSRIDGVGAWVKQGMSHAKIVEAIGRGEAA